MRAMAPVTGERIAADAVAWRDANPAAWAAMRRIALGRLAEGRRTSIAELAEEARYSMRVEGLDAGFRVNNTTRAGLARLMMAECPALAGAMEVRRSKADDADWGAL